MTPSQHQQALTHAIESIKWRLEAIEDWLYDPVELLVWCHFSRIHRQAVLAMGRAGQSRAHSCLCGMAEYLTSIGDPLPSWLQDYVVFFLQHARLPKKRGRSKATNALRDVAIVQTIAMLTNSHDLQPTRNAATTLECGCSILSEALLRVGIDMGEANVAAIWSKSGGNKILLDLAPSDDPCFELLGF